MGALRCVDGSVLSVQAVTCRDRAGQPYEITLTLARDSVPFAAVGQRCGYQLSQLAQRLSVAREDPEQAAAWPDPDDRFPVMSAGPQTGYLPGDHEYFALRARDRTDLPGTGELRCLLRSSAEWQGECMGTGHRSRRVAAVRPPAGAPGSWRLTRRAVIEAWGTGGVGVRAVLTSAELVAFLDTVLRETESAESAGTAISAGSDASPNVRATDLPSGQRAGKRPGSVAMPLWRQRGKGPDGIARSRLPALRAQARGGAGALGDTASRRGDVRR